MALTTSVGSSSDPVDEAVRRDGFQRAAVVLASSIGNVVAGQVGDHGVVFLSAGAGTAQRRKTHLLDLAERARVLARRFDLEPHFGASGASRPPSIHHVYEVALGAAESALIQGTRMVVAEPSEGRPTHSLRRLRQGTSRRRRRAFALTNRRGSTAISKRWRSSTGIEWTARADIWKLASIVLQKRCSQRAGSTKRASRHRVTRSSAQRETLARCRSCWRPTEERPLIFECGGETASKLRHDRGLRAALDHIDRHYTEPLDVKKVARVAGFTPNYFSKLFSAREKMTFVDYVALRRVERAKKLLSGTGLDATRVAELSGFNSPQYFSRVFRRATGTTPLGYRNRPQKDDTTTEPWSVPHTRPRKKRTKRN